MDLRHCTPRCPDRPPFWLSCNLHRPKFPKTIESSAAWIIYHLGTLAVAEYLWCSPRPSSWYCFPYHQSFSSNANCLRKYATRKKAACAWEDLSRGAIACTAESRSWSTFWGVRNCQSGFWRADGYSRIWSSYLMRLRSSNILLCDFLGWLAFSSCS